MAYTMSNSHVITMLTVIFFLQQVKYSILKTPVKLPVVEQDKFCALANKYYLNCVRYDVTTEDGYVLGVYNIPGDRHKPVYLQHGFVDSSDTFLIRGNTSLAAFLSRKRYDVWLGNTRGNVHSREHQWLNPDGLRFWEFSFHEIGLYDVPAIIDFILNKTGEKQLQAIAHSEGTTSFFVMGAMRPEYNKKVKILICLAPIAYLHRAESPVLRLISSKGALSDSVTVSGHGDVLRNSSALMALLRVKCMQKLIGFSLCVNNFLVNIFGRDRKHPEPEFWSTSLQHYPCGSSLKNGLHLLQIASRRKFAQYDYGSSQNMAIYNSQEPPKYNLSKVCMKLALVIGWSDRLSDVKDVELLRRQLPHVVDYHVMNLKEWSHLDFVWGRNMHGYLFGYIEDILQKYF